MRVLVSGSSGQLGSYVRELLMPPHEAIGLDIRPSAHEPAGGRTLTCDIRNAREVDRCVHGTDAIVHCAAQVSVERSFDDPVTDVQTNVLGTVNMLHAAAGARVRRFVYVSSAAVYGNPRRIPIDEDHPTEPMSNYGASKLAGERFALSYSHSTNMEVAVVRPFNFYSPRADPESPYSGVITKFVRRVQAGKPPLIEGDGTHTRDFIHAKDVAGMILSMLERDDLSGQVLNCGSGTSTSVLELAHIVIGASGKALEPEFVEPRKGDIRDSLADITKARNLLAFSSRITLKEGISELLN